MEKQEAKNKIAKQYGIDTSLLEKASNGEKEAAEKVIQDLGFKIYMLNDEEKKVFSEILGRKKYCLLTEEEEKIIRNIFSNQNLTSERLGYSREEKEEICQKWLEKSGFKFDEDKNCWVDTENDNEEAGETAVEAVSNGGYENDTLQWIFDNDEKIREDLLERLDVELEERKIQEILNDDEKMREIAQKYNLEEKSLIRNAKTGGKISRRLVLAYLGIDFGILELADEDGNWLVPKLLAVSNYRHNFTDYDEIDKSNLDEFEVDEIRRRANASFFRNHKSNL